MTVSQKRQDFLISEEGMLCLKELQLMALDEKYNTQSSYSANVSLYADNLISFVDKHMSFLRDHPDTNAQQYIANLRLMTKVR